MNIGDALRRLLVAGVLLATVGVVAADGGAASKTLTVKGTVSQPTTYSLAALQALPQQEVSVPAADGTPRIQRALSLNAFCERAFVYHGGVA